MNATEFLRLIWPTGTHFFLTLIKNGYARNQHVLTPENAAGIAKNADPATNVYFAMSSYKALRDENGQQRTQINADRVKCFWLDLDCKGRAIDYASPQTARDDVARYCNETNMPSPTVTVSSGYGVHIYWVLDQDISAKEWLVIANKFKNSLNRHGVKHDSSCTTDSARVLRVPGGINVKEGRETRDVAIYSEGSTLTLDTFVGALADIGTTTALVPLDGFTIYEGADLSINDAGVYVVEHRPSSIIEIVKHCGLLKAIGNSGGDVTEPLWKDTLGLLKFTIEAEKAQHVFSRGHVGYSFEATVEKTAGCKNTGPISCDQFQKSAYLEMPEHCASCQYRGTIQGPAQLGYPKVLMTETVTVQLADEQVEKRIEVPAIPPSMQNMFKWDAGKLWKSVAGKKDKDSEGGAKTEIDWIPFSDFFFYPVSYYDDETDKHRMSWTVRDREGVYRDFDISGGSIGAGGQSLFKELGDCGISMLPGGKMPAETYISKFASEIKKMSSGTNTYTHFGWHGDDFLLGDTMIKRGGELEHVRVGGSAKALAKHFAPKGTRDRWVELIDKAYNYEGQEQYQFILGTGYGAPLLELMGIQGGLVMSAISYDSGQGKSTAGMMATGIFGCGRSSEGLSLSVQSSTMNAVFAMAGVLHSLPLCIDEMTNILPPALSNMIYQYSQGTGKVTVTQSGALNHGRHSWSGFMNFSANKPMSHIIATSKPGADAELARMVEFQFGNVSKLTKEEADAIFGEILNECYGAAGLEYMLYIQTHTEEVKTLFRSVRKIIDKELNLVRRDRYWSHGLTADITGLMIAHKIGQIRFSIKNILTWLKSIIGEIRAANTEVTATPEECFSRMLTDLSPGLIVTDIEGDRRKKVPTTPFLIREPRAPYTGRAIIEEGVAYLTQPAVSKWCVEHQVGMKNMMAEAVKQGWVKSDDTVKHFPAKGTDISMGQFRCYVLDLVKLETSAASMPKLAVVTNLKECSK